MNHEFDVNLAKAYGVKEAIILEMISKTIAATDDSEIIYADERAWVKISASYLHNMMPYMTQNKISRNLQSLVAQGALLSTHFPENKLDRTLWYSIV